MVGQHGIKEIMLLLGKCTPLMVIFRLLFIPNSVTLKLPDWFNFDFWKKLFSKLIMWMYIGWLFQYCSISIKFPFNWIDHRTNSFAEWLLRSSVNDYTDMLNPIWTLIALRESRFGFSMSVISDTRSLSDKSCIKKGSITVNCYLAIH